MTTRRLQVEALQKPRQAAYRPGQFVDQENFMEADEILDLARRAGIATGTRVLDLCCGVAGPGLHIARHCGSSHLGVDCDEEALTLARERAQGLPCEFHQAQLPGLPVIPPPPPKGTPADFEVVLLLETILAFPDKAPLLAEIRDQLRPGGRLAMTWEEGAPLSAEERRSMPNGDTVWLTPLEEIHRLLSEAGLQLQWIDDHTPSHREVASRLAQAFQDHQPALAQALGPSFVADLLTSHRLWVEWMDSGRVRKFALVAGRA